jgi:serine/threonine protein kinase/tetratricopeptide (TPR) repeat protein
MGVAADQTNREKEIFEGALDRAPGEERQRYIEVACGTDPALLARIQALLQANDLGEDFLPEEPGRRPARGPALTSFLTSELSEKTGDAIGRYKLLQKIGEGGCGVVYMAEQEEPVRRKVALKIIKLGMDTKQVVVRFEAERQALAMMDHTNIAKVLDAGATETGRPYFVMELVGGTKITDYCDQNQLTTRQRLDLFIQVCRAIQHAHQKGVIHRDIKPSNVLVATQDGAPVPKVIDFGIAKATQGRLTDQTVFTAFEQFLGTPAYMSPEQTQLGSLDVDTRSDIYSLGVLLYELLTGKTPFDSKELLAAGLDAMRRTIQEKEPPTPSTRLKQELAARSAGSDKSALLTPHSTPDKDLDWIVMKCLEKDRARRYETANGLAADIERHLKNEPVVASPPSGFYRFQKLVHRNRVIATSTVVVALVLILGVVASTWQAVRATEAEREQRRLREQAQTAQANETREREKAQTEASRSQQVAAFLQKILKSAGPSIAAGRDTEILREVLDNAAARIAIELTNQPAVEAELRNTIGFAYRELGEDEKSEIMYRRCLELSRRIGGDELALADILHKLADLLRSRGNFTGADYMYIEAEEMEREALAIYTRVHGREHLSVGASLHYLADILLSQGKLNEAEDACRESLAINQRLCEPDHPNVGVCLGQRGIVLTKQGKLAEAEIVLQSAVAILRKALVRPQGSWSGLNPHVELANGLVVTGKLFIREGRLDEAEMIYRESLAVRTKVQGNYHRDVVGSTIGLANLLAAQGRLNEAESLLRECVAALKGRFTDNHRLVYLALEGLGRLLQQYGKLAEAEVVWSEALAIEKKLFGEEHPLVAKSLQELASVLHGQGNPAGAEALLRQSLIILEKSLPDVWETFNTRSLLGASLVAQEKYAEAEPLLITGYEGLKRREDTVPGDSRLLRLKEALQRLVNLYETTNRPEQAAAWKRKLEQLESHANLVQ